MKKFKDFDKPEDTEDTPSKDNLVNVIANWASCKCSSQISINIE